MSLFDKFKDKGNEEESGMVFINFDDDEDTIYYDEDEPILDEEMLRKERMEREASKKPEKPRPKPEQFNLKQEPQKIMEDVRKPMREEPPKQNKPKKKKKRGLFQRMNLVDLKTYEPEKKGSGGKTERDMKILELLGISPEPPELKDVLTKQESKRVSFDLIAPTGLDPKQVRRYCAKVEKTIFRYERAREEREKDFAKLLDEVSRLEQEISGRGYDDQMHVLSLEEEIADLKYQNSLLENEIAELRAKTPEGKTAKAIQEQSDSVQLPTLD